MPRTARSAPGGYVYHIINRGVGRMTLFHKDADYAAFLRVLAQTQQLLPMRLLAYCIMPNHWHFVLWPRHDGDLARFMQRLTVTHVRRWQEHKHRVGEGHVYQGRYKSFPVSRDAYFLALCRYVERNALRANLVERAQDWPWSSLWQRTAEGKTLEVGEDVPQLHTWPVERPRNWVRRVNQAESEAELEALRRSVVRGQPYGGESWCQRVTKLMGLESTYRNRGRPRKEVSDVKG